jgi:2-polyprenyl-3-methyl-5-hydroxy-6-metoxy-1,4-benzoquinol methylase
VSTSLSDAEAIERLRSTSPYTPEPPRKNRVVEAFMAVAERRNKHYYTPHLAGGTDQDKVDFEYGGAQDFWDRIEHVVGMDVIDGKDVVDVGCGWGGKMLFWAERGSPRSVTGFDIPGVFDPEVPAALARERGFDNLSFDVGLAEDIPYGDESFDVAIMDDVMEHVKSPEKAIAECYRILRPGGTMIAKYPSFRMMRAHHLDRALSYPGLHYLMSMRTWAAGLNYHLIHSGHANYEPFPRIVSTPYRDEITSDLNGLDFAGTKEALARSGFEVLALDMLGLPPHIERDARPIVKRTYYALRSIPALREFLSSAVVFVARK